MATMLSQKLVEAQEANDTVRDCSGPAETAIRGCGQIFGLCLTLTSEIFLELACLHINF